MKIAVFTRSMNYDLYTMSRNTISPGYKSHRYQYTTADGYFYRMLRSDADIAVNIDEDAFVIDNERLKSLIEYCLDNDFVNCGFPDGGVLEMRIRNPLVTNPFFNILNLSAIRKEFSPEVLQPYTVHNADYEKKAPWHLIKSQYEFGIFERYYPFFIWVSQKFKVLYLDAENHSDGYSTILKDHKGDPFLLHSWYSRDFNSNQFHNERITNLYREALMNRPEREKLALKDNVIKATDRIGNFLYYKAWNKLRKNL